MWLFIRDVGLQVAKACAPCSVLLTDNQPAAILNAQHNVNANDLSSSSEPVVTVDHCDWAVVASMNKFDCPSLDADRQSGSGIASAREQAPEGLNFKLREVDTIIAADVVSACSSALMYS